MPEAEPPTNTDAADEFRLKGNAAYKAGRLNDGKKLSIKTWIHDLKLMFLYISALELYMQALSLSENDLKILSNISAAKYEIGDYQGCIETTEDCFKFVGDDEKQKHYRLLVRRAKCYFYLGMFDEFSKTIQELPEFATKGLLEDMMRIMKSRSEGVALAEKMDKKLADNFSLYKQSMYG